MVTKGYGFSVEDIDGSCPADLETYAKVHKLEQKEVDSMAWLLCGNYILSALTVAMEHCLAGGKAKSEYIKEPVLNKLDEYESLSQEEVDRRELQKMLFAEKQWQMAGEVSKLPPTVIV